MKQTFRRKQTVTIFGAIALSVLFLCTVFSVILALRQDYIFLMALFFPALLGILFAMIAFIEYRGSIVLDDQTVKFNYRLFSKSTELNKSGVELPYSEIESIRKTYIKGDGIVSKDGFLYTIYLTNNKNAEVYLYHFGKDEETIFSTISERLCIKE